jgi:hypothetical protein
MLAASRSRDPARRDVRPRGVISPTRAVTSYFVTATVRQSAACEKVCDASLSCAIARSAQRFMQDALIGALHRAGVVEQQHEI